MTAHSMTDMEAQSGNDFRSADERELSAAATLNRKTEIAVLAAEG
jgi:hypothetical protein